MILMITLLMFWLSCAPVTYLRAREEMSSPDRKWTHFDRLFWVSVSTLYGPILLVVVLAIDLIEKLSECEWARREAKW
jgi:hypothetical protein